MGRNRTSGERKGYGLNVLFREEQTILKARKIRRENKKKKICIVTILAIILNRYKKNPLWEELEEI